MNRQPLLWLLALCVGSIFYKAALRSLNCVGKQFEDVTVCSSPCGSPGAEREPEPDTD